MLRTPVRIVPQRADKIVKQVVAASAKRLACADTETSPSVVGRLPGRHVEQVRERLLDEAGLSRGSLFFARRL